MFTHSALLCETSRLRNFALRLTRNSADADDLVQSTCLRALEKADLFEDESNLFSWTSKMMFNLFVSGYRRREKFETDVGYESYLEACITQPDQELAAELANIKRAMLNLSASHREILQLICIDGLRYDEVALKLVIPIGTVRSRLSRARTQIQHLLKMPQRTAAREPKHHLRVGSLQSVSTLISQESPHEKVFTHLNDLSRINDSLASSRGDRQLV
jgi:RNA polymerase sigma-70 factor (ECF subfamily)